MAAQIIADLKYTRILSMDMVDDWWTWCVLGPGSRRGLNRLLGRSLDLPPESSWRASFHYARKTINPSLRTDGNRSLCAQDFQNSLCEWDKYERVLWGQGRSKRKYNGWGI